MNVLFIVTRIIDGSGEWQNTWNFDLKKQVVFVFNDTKVTYDIPPQSLNEVSFVVIRGDKDHDVITTVVNLINQYFQQHQICLLIHPGGGGELNRALPVLNQRLLSQNRGNWDTLIRSCITYSIGGGTLAEQTIGKVVSSLATHRKNGSQKDFQKTLTALLNVCLQGPKSDNDKTEKVGRILNEKIKKEEIPLAVDTLKTLTLLKHHIAHLFLPLDIDLQGICDVLSPTFIPPSDRFKKEELAEEYYKEAFPKSPKEIFEEKLGKAKKIIESEASDEVKSKISEKLEDNGVEELKDQLGKPGSEGDLETFRTWAQENKDHFHFWFCELVESLNKT